ncbi:MAG TPA: hypothetical protein VEU62_18185 [Bryobacterales bacterium]|nr:hypothetical protein [Bryobacterales bacterium]
MRAWIFSFLFAAMAWSAAAPQQRASEPAPKIINVDYRIFPDLADMDGHWAALLAASDGRVYIGLAHHGADGHLVCYDSKDDRMQDLGAVTALVGEQFLHRGPQAKIHTKFGEGRDGRIYFGSEYGRDFNFARYATPEGYPGGHWMAYDPRAGRVSDLGIGLAPDGIIAGAYDPVFHRIYGISDPRGHFIYYDVAKGVVGDLGRVNNWDSLCRSIAVDDQGNVYGSFGRGQIYKYNPRTGTLRELSVRLPIREKGISLGRDYHKSETAWRVVVWDQQTRKFYGVEESASTLFSFDPNAGEDGEIRTLGQLCIPGSERSRDVPYATLSLTLGRDRKLYYAAAGREFDYSGSAGLAASHLLTYDLATAKIEDHGEMRLSDGRRVIGTNSASTGPDGAVYFGGAIEVRPEAGKPVEAGGKIGNAYYRLALLIYHPHG